MDKAVKTYRALALIPTNAGGKVSSNGRIIHTKWTQRNIERGKTVSFAITNYLNENHQCVDQLLPTEIRSELLSRTSPSGKYRAVLRDVENKEPKQFLEVWEKNNMIRSVDLKTLDVHGNVYTDGEFNSFEWSPNETELLYIAERKLKKSQPFYKRQAPKDEIGCGDDKEKTKNEKEETTGEEYLYRQDWGEQLVGKKYSDIAVYNIEDDSVKILKGVPDDVCPATVIWNPAGNSVIGMALKTLPRKLGLIYCSNRVSTIFSLDMEGNYLEMNLPSKSVKSPRITPDNKSLIWLQREAGGPHGACLSLCRTSLPISVESVPEIIVDVVPKSIAINGGLPFYGLYNAGFIQRCWTNDGRLVVNSIKKSESQIYLVNLDTKSITEVPIKEGGSHYAIDVHNDFILVNTRNYLRTDLIRLSKIQPEGQESSMPWFNIIDSEIPLGLNDFTYRYLDLKAEYNPEQVHEFNAIYIGPKDGNPASIPLVVSPHGGPHSVFTNNYSLELSLMLNFGYAVLLINYRGSLGMGEENVNFLRGRVGTADVSDCIVAVKKALQEFPWLDEKRMVLTGGSHGGFLVTHLSGQYPDMFRAVVSRNPVIDIASMSIISDIPDWCLVEAGAEYSQKGQPSEEMLLAMRKASPIQHAHKVKAPTLLQIGSKDLRVPPHQGMEYYYRLVANENTTVRMNLYDDNHPLGLVPNEMDNVLNSLLWFEEHSK